jgi:hypothetical protein
MAALGSPGEVAQEARPAGRLAHPRRLLALGRRLGYDELMDTIERTLPATSTTSLQTSTRRFVLAWVVMVGGLAGFWCCRPWLGTRTFNIGQIVIL